MRFLFSICVFNLMVCLAPLSWSQETSAPEGISREAALPNRHRFVAQDILKYCKPEKGFWVDLGAGRGQLTIPLIEAAENPVVMVDPDVEAMVQGLRIAREKELEDRLFAVVGVAESLPFPDDSVDLLVSRGSIFFWDDPVKGLQEVYRVLRPGAPAYIGGGAGSGFPQEAAEELVRMRVEQLEGADAARWRRFVDLRCPKQMDQWAAQAELPRYTVMGKGAISADDPRVGQGVWLLFHKQQNKK